jgi:hypothetical protein
MPERSAVAAVVRLVGWLLVGACLCADKRKHNGGSKAWVQIPNARYLELGRRPGGVGDGEGGGGSGAWQCSHYCTTATSNKYNRQGRQGGREGDVALEDWRRLIWNRSLPGRLRAWRERLVRETSILRGSVVSAVGRMRLRMEWTSGTSVKVGSGEGESW